MSDTKMISAGYQRDYSSGQTCCEFWIWKMLLQNQIITAASTKKTQKKIGSLESIQAFLGADFCAAFSERAILRQLPHESMLKCVLVELLVKFRVKIIVVF